jgi:ABC-type transporter Mla subunit MlaD
MSLGPPFDDSGLRLQRAVGAFVVIALACAVAWVLLRSGRTIGRGHLYHVLMRKTGPLVPGAKVRLAGREVGEVRTLGARRIGGELYVDIGAFILQSAAEHIHVNTDFFVSTPSVLGEGFLEVGPPNKGAPPGEIAKPGFDLYGSEPPDLDRFFVKTEASIREVLSLLRENKGVFDEVLDAGDKLIATLSGLPGDKGQLRRVADNAVAAIDQGQALLAALRGAGGLPRIRAIGQELAALAEKTGPELSALGDKLTRALDRIDQLRSLASDRNKDDLRTAIGRFRDAVAVGQRLIKDVRALVARVERGQGTFGALLADKELFDDLHETHGIIKGQPLRFLLKTVKPTGEIKSP